MDDIDYAHLTIEAIVLMVQNKRALTLEKEVRDQMIAIKERNDKITELNSLMTALHAVRPTGANTGPDTYGNLGSDKAAGEALYARALAAGIKMPDPNGPDRVDEPGTGIYDAKQKTIDVWTEQIKGDIDQLSSTQQTDLVRLQSYNNKYNECMELSTNIVKKASDENSGIIRNI